VVLAAQVQVVQTRFSQPSLPLAVAEEAEQAQVSQVGQVEVVAASTITPKNQAAQVTHQAQHLVRAATVV
jgi:hypothetical protein